MEQDKIIELPSGESMFIDWESVIIIREVSESLQVIPIENLNLPSRIVDILYDNDIKTVEELSSLSDDDLKKMRGVGGATLKIIKNALQEIA